MSKKDGCHPEVWTNLACTYFFLGMYKESDDAVRKGIFSLCSLYSHILHNLGISP